jgi:peptide/nickel transport system ATP-binding protein
MQTKPLAKIKNLSISFGDKKVLESIYFDIYKGECLCLVGESGSGKSLSAYSLIDLLPETAKINSGFVYFEDQNVFKLSDSEKQKLRGNKIGFIFQEPLSALNPVFSIGQQIEEALKLHSNLSKIKRQKRVIQLLEKVNIDNPKQRFNSYPHELSGGQRQRVCIAMALANQCKLLIADEPTTALDVSIQKEILELIKTLQAEEGLSVLFISHDISVVEEMADRVIVMHKGQIVEQGPKNNVLNNPQQEYTQKLLSSMPGKSAYIINNNKQNKILNINNLSKEFIVKHSIFKKALKIKALDKVTLSLTKGQTIAIVGESGSGKSTLARCITGLTQADSGEINFKMIDINKSTDKELKKIRKDIQMIFQDPLDSLNPRLKIIDSVSEGIKAYKLMPNKKIRPYLEKIFTDCRLETADLDKYPHEFSGGQRQRICIAKAIALKPKILIADEAVSALDLSVQEQILLLLKRLKAKYNLSIIFITHDLRVVKEIADYVVVLQKGKAVEQGNCAEIFENPQQEYTQKLLKSIPGQL